MTVEAQIRELAEQYAKTLRERVDARRAEMVEDDTSHYLIYRALGVDADEGRTIDFYQNKGRFLYSHAGLFLERAARLCFRSVFPDAGSVRIPNTLGQRPKTFEIDCLIENRDAVEIKWRDATTDGDHIAKEHTRIRVIRSAGFKPIRVMFFYPNREQAIRIQRNLEDLYEGVNGEYHYGTAAWQYVRNYTGVDLLALLESIASERMES